MTGRTNCGVTGTGKLPEFSYTGECEVVQEGGKNWHINLLTNGTIKIAASNGIDIFAVGGGGGGSGDTSHGTGYLVVFWAD